MLGKKTETPIPQKIEEPNEITESEEITQPKQVTIQQMPQEDVKLSGNKIMKAGIKKEKGYLYFVDEDGDIARAKMARGKTKKGEKQKKEKIKETESEEIEETNNKKEVTLDDISNLLLGGRR